MNIHYQSKIMQERDSSIKTSIELIFDPGFWILFFHLVGNTLYESNLFFLARLISQIGRFFTGIEIHPGAIIGKGLFIDHGHGVVIGETCEIGDNVVIYQGVTLGGTGKDTGKRHPTIGNNVLIGAGAKVLGPIKIGDNSRIGAGSVVLQEVSENSTVVGVPARSAKKTQEEVVKIYCLEHSKIADPVSIELCMLKRKVELLEREISQMNKGDEKINGSL